MKIIQIINARQIVNAFTNDNTINTRLAYWMTKFVVKTQSEYDFYIREMQKILAKYATETDDGNLVVAPENIEAFNTEVAELENTEVEDPGIRFALSDLSGELKLSMKQIFPLLDFIDEDK